MEQPYVSAPCSLQCSPGAIDACDYVLHRCILTKATLISSESHTELKSQTVTQVVAEAVTNARKGR